jgi:predicted dehydrogenase
MLQDMFDFNPETLQRMAGKYSDVKIGTSYDEILEDAGTDTVVNATPPSRTTSGAQGASRRKGREKKSDLVNGQFVTEKPAAQTITYPMDELLRLECEHFLECVRTCKTPKTDGHDSWRVLKALEAPQPFLSMNWEPCAVVCRAVFGVRSCLK